MSNKVKDLAQFMLDNNIEIVSYGLAPNPNGFCFECHDDSTPDHVKKYVSKELNTLTKVEIDQLKKASF